ncbi:hypothetical protein [Streptomyces griseoviridis]|uniref:Uncharacterized protein n=1 Tax=Streptomyces griseoviridis TaxID=45398 RepID=A0ABT9LQF5_STRGD|nr:hypothetical protein [Streptomyces griseoviridis]MDP9685715.1 hypothetical protein [Streptomyces griseoviridis]GGS76722.1 hypothetical protein GCM10010240_07050 [Streptomyces griseoviridis]
MRQRPEPEERAELLRMEPAGISSARPSRSSEITAARHDEITAHLREAGPGALADLGFAGLDDQRDDDPVIITGREATRNHRLTDAEKEANRLISRGRAAGEHGSAHLTSWHILTEVRMNARHATTLLRAPPRPREHRSRGDRRSPRSDHDADRQESVTPGAHQPHPQPRDLRNQDETVPLVVRGVRRTYPVPERRASSRTSRSAQ